MSMNKNTAFSIRSIMLMLVLGLIFACAAGSVDTYAASSDDSPEHFGYDIFFDDYVGGTYMEATDRGYMRVLAAHQAVWIEYYDDNFELIDKKSVDMELDVWGGFFKGSDAYYLVEGNYNEDCIDGTEVVRIIKYDTSWNRLGSGSIYAKDGWDYEIRYPFHHASVNMTETGGKLYVATGRQGYVDPKVGQGHQGMMLIRMDESTFDTEIVYGDFWHSFAQYIDHKGSDVFIYELSEGSRCTQLSRFDANSTGTDYFNAMEECFPVLKYGGSRTSAWAIPCYATVEGLALSADNVLGIGTSIDQSRYDSYSEDYQTNPYNLYLTVTPFSNLSAEATEVKWLTSFSNAADYILDAEITKINDNRFMVFWEMAEDDIVKPSDKSDLLSSRTLHFMFIDGAGNKLSDEYTVRAAFPDGKPLVRGNSVVYCASGESQVNFYFLNTDTCELSKRVYRALSIEDAEISKIPDQTYTGEEILPKPVVTMDGKVLEEDKDYFLEYECDNMVGGQTLYVFGKGAYIGEVPIGYRIVPQGTSFSKVKAGKKSLSLKWKKQANQTSGYQIQYATDKKFKRGKKTITVKGNKNVSKKIKKLKSKKKYYVRIRTYRLIDGEKYCSVWSTAKAVKVK